MCPFSMDSRMKSSILKKLLTILLVLTVIPLGILGYLAVNDAVSLGGKAAGEAKLIGETGISSAKEIGELAVGDSKTVTIPAVQAYGNHNPEMVQDVPRSAIPTDIDLQEGMILSARSPEGHNLNFKVVEFDEQKVKVDGNHPLAGEDLTFALELVAIN